MGHSKGRPQREVHSDIGLPKTNRNISHKQSNLHLQEFEEQQHRQPRASRRKEITKIKAELNDTERIILRINKSRR